jgi:hypothetical protein
MKNDDVHRHPTSKKIQDSVYLITNNITHKHATSLHTNKFRGKVVKFNIARTQVQYAIAKIVKPIASLHISKFRCEVVRLNIAHTR